MRESLAIVHPEITIGGGSEARALWLITAFKEDFQVSIITQGKVDLEKLNDFYGTKIDPHEVSIVSIPSPPFLTKRFDALRRYRWARYCQNVADKYRIMISSYNVMDFGRRGIQFIGDFSFDDRLRRRFVTSYGSRKVFYQKSVFRQLYLFLAKRLTRQTQEGWKNNLTIANSQWAAEILKKAYGMNCPVVYPAVSADGRGVPWEKRENGFLAIGRFSPEKRYEDIINTLSGVRKAGHNIHLHILGGEDVLYYSDWVKRLIKQNQEWVTWEGLAGSAKKIDLMSKHRYGISGCRFEAFGIAIAEMVKAGCCVWVPRGGGQVEIVKQNLLIYQDLDEAVSKIEKVLENPSLQKKLLKHLALQADKFSPQRFMESARNVVHQFLEETDHSRRTAFAGNKNET